MGNIGRDWDEREGREVEGRGSATPMKMGGGGRDQAASKPGFSSEATHTKNRKLSGFGPLFS